MKKRLPITSDHFDGKQFFNPTLPKGFFPGLASVFKMLREKRNKWPTYVENTTTPQLNTQLGPDDVAITFVNHATFLIQLQGMNILTDPVWALRAGPFGWLGPKRVRKPGVRFEDLPKIDLVLLSHNHYDHFDKATLKKINKRFASKVLVASGDKRLAESLDFTDVHEFDWWEQIQINPELTITYAPTQHFAARGLGDRFKSLWGSYMIQHREKLIYFGGDSGYSPHFSEIKKRLGSPDIAILGMGAYEPRWFMKPMHMNPAEAVKAHQDLGSKQSIGMHFGTFQLSNEAIDQPKIDLKHALAEAGISEEKFVTLHEGETRVY